MYPVLWANPDVPFTTPDASDPRSAEDAESIAQLQARNPSHLAILFERYHRLLLGTACRVLRDPSEAEDLVQDVFFYVYRRSELFDPSKGTFKTWIIQITFCRALDRKLYLARRGFYAAGHIDVLNLSRDINVEQQLDAQLSRKVLERAFADLTEMQRRTIQFFYFEGLDLREISQVLSKPLGTVRHHLYRGLARLRKSSHLHRLL